MFTTSFLIRFQFRERTDRNLKQKRLTEDDRKYIVRTLATMLLVHIQKPSKNDCVHVAKSLVRNHFFLKEYVSTLLTTHSFVLKRILYSNYSTLGQNFYMFVANIVIGSPLALLSLSKVRRDHHPNYNYKVTTTPW